MLPIEIVDYLQKKGYEAYFVGGCVRDMLMGLEAKDIDIVTSAYPGEVVQLFKQQDVKEVGKSFGVILVDDIEVATFRSDVYYGGSDKNCNIKYVKTLREDVVRRDFTINGIAYDPIRNKIYDYVNGQVDIKDRTIMFIGDSYKRIVEDPNRIIRACRFYAKIDGQFEDDTFRSLFKYSGYISNLVAPERIRLEILKAMKIKKASKFFTSLHDIGALKYILPSLDNCYLHPGGPYHIEDVYDHCMMSGDHIITKYPLIKLAGYLHDVGKPISCKINPNTDDIWFKFHEKDGEEIVFKELQNLRFSKDEAKYISKLVSFHMRINHERLSPTGVRRTLRYLTDDSIPYKDLLRVSIGDKMGGLKSQKYYTLRDVYNLSKTFRKIINEKPVRKFGDLKINGNEIMEITGLKPCKKIGEILNYLMDQVTENPELNDPGKLADLVKEKFDDIQI